jgi:hypothetical protein
MKLHFEPNLDYQLAAVEAVCELSRGKEICRTEFTVTYDAADLPMRIGFAENDIGIGNRLHLLGDAPGRRHCLRSCCRRGLGARRRATNTREAA